ncbi:sulfite exporter TauE/SafE family protein [Acutalibacter muris]|nr:sulfite exporter TauE/SafE family protein [Acutalibacter muris]
MTELVMLLVCLIASGLGSVAGFGGGVIIKPVLDALNVLPVSTISFLSGCTVLAMSVVSLLKSRGNGVKLQIRTTMPLAAGAAVGGLIGKWLFELIKSSADENVLGLCQSALLLALTVLVWIYTVKRDCLPSYRLENLQVCGLAGLGLGMVSSFLGIGGGPMNVALLFLLFSMDAKTAAKNSIFIILFSQAASLASALCQQNVPYFAWHQLTLMVAGGVGGALLGAAMSRRMDNRAVERLLMALMLIILIVNGYNIFHFAFGRG